LKKIFSILLSLALVMGLVGLTAAPVMAVTLPSISPTSATFNLDLPAQVVVGVTWGSANETSGINITNTGTGGTLTAGVDYILFDTIVVFDSTYLGTVLTAAGQTLNLQFNFDMTTYIFSCYATITATGTNPSVSPATANWNFNTKGNVTTAIAWGYAANVTSIGDDAGNIGTGNWSRVGTVLKILQSYFVGRWPTVASIGKSVVLNIAFDKGNNATLTVSCTGFSTASLAPTTLYYNFNVGGNVTSAITWGPAVSISVIKDVTYLMYPYPIDVVGGGSNWTVSADNTTLIFLSGYLALNFNYPTYAAGRTYRYYEVTFSDGSKVNLTLVINPTLPTLSPTSLNWNLDGMPVTAPYVYTVPAFGDSTNVTKVKDQFGYNLSAYNPGNSSIVGACGLPGSFDYRVSYNPLIGVYVMSIWYCYFIYPNPVTGNVTLSKLGDIAQLTVFFNKGTSTGPTAAVNVTAIGTGAKLSIATADFNLDTPADVSGTITWGNFAKNVTSITTGSGSTLATLVRGSDYTLTPDGGNATTPSTLTIKVSYLSGVLAAIGDSVTLTINYDQQVSPSKLVITAVGTPSCVIATAVGEDENSLNVLRAFRDNVLRQNVLGRAAIRAYYAVSPHIAPFVAGNAALKAAVKGVVDLIVRILS